MADHEGKPDAGGMSFAIVASRFNDFIVDNLVQGATDQLIELGTSKDAIQLYQVPGAVEIPLINLSIPLRSPFSRRHSREISNESPQNREGSEFFVRTFASVFRAASNRPRFRSHSPV